MKLTITLICLIILRLNVYCQSAATIENTNFALKEGKLYITYDIANYQTGEKFKVWVNIFDNDGKKIPAQSFSEDIGETITGGSGKTIIWDINKDTPNFNEEIYAEVYAQSLLKGNTEKTVTTGKLLLNSTLFPGWGNYTLQKKGGWWLMGVAAYSSIAGSVILNYLAAADYDKYLLAETNDRDKLYNKSQTNKMISTVLFATAAAVWAVEYTAVYINAKKTAKKNKLTSDKK